MSIVARGLARGSSGTLVALGFGRSITIAPPDPGTWPRVATISANRLKISGKVVARVSFTFAQPVDEWVVMVGGTSPFDGTLVDFEMRPGMLSGSVDVARAQTKHGMNKVKVYCRVGKRWSL